MPNALDGEGIWAAHGVNAAGVGMTATETITSNARVLGADPLVEYVPAKDGVEELSGGIGEEDIVSLVLPYIHSAREGVTSMGEHGFVFFRLLFGMHHDEFLWHELSRRGIVVAGDHGGTVIRRLFSY